MPDQGVHEWARVGRIGDDHLSAAVLVERQGVLAGRNVARIGAAQPEAFQVAHQGAVTATRLGERAHTAQPRNQRQHRRARRRIKIAFAPFKGRTLAHLRPVSVAGGRPARGFRCDLGPRPAFVAIALATGRGGGWARGVLGDTPVATGRAKRAGCPWDTSW